MDTESKDNKQMNKHTRNGYAEVQAAKATQAGNAGEKTQTELAACPNYFHQYEITHTHTHTHTHSLSLSLHLDPERILSDHVHRHLRFQFHARRWCWFDLNQPPF